MLENKELNELLDSHYENEPSQTLAYVQSIAELYGLETIRKEFEANEELITFAGAHKCFFVVAAYNEKGEVLVLDGSNSVFPDDRGFKKRLLGKAFKRIDGLVEEQIDRYVSTKYGLSFVELNPIAALENTFRFGEITEEHVGIAFAGFYTGKPTEVENVSYTYALQPPEEMIFDNKRVFELARNHIGSRRFVPSEREALSHQRPLWKEIIHNCVRKVTFKWSSGRLRKHCLRIVEKVEAKTVIDLAAGNDELILDVAKDENVAFVVANDLAFNSMQHLRRKAGDISTKIFFTNHDVATLAFNKRFDLAILKNTLHHIGGSDEMKALLKKLGEVCDQCLIVEIENPKMSIRGRLFNFYYENFYGDGDDDHKYFDRDIMKRMLALAYGEDKIEIASIGTIKGDYLAALVDVSEGAK